MTSIIKFSPISGAHDESPPCYLLEIDDFCILLDCGLNSHLDFSLLEPLKKVANRIDAVLISYPDITHLGALPWAVNKLGITAMIYGTTPIYKMGQMFLYDLYQNKMEQEEFDKFDLDDVDACFDKKRFKELSFSQHYSLQGKGKGISITPYNAGHMIGGAIWKITKESDTIVYAVNYNHKQEGHLDGIHLPNDILKPSLLITDCRNSNSPPSLKKLDRDRVLLDYLKQTLRAGGNVLIPCDTAGRVLELLLSIEGRWNQSLSIYNVVFLNFFTYNICEFAKSQLEFMSTNASSKFEQKNENSFQFRYIKLIHSLRDLDNTSTNGKIVLASSGDLETGFARDLFIKWASDPKNLLLFTDHQDPNTLGSFLLGCKDSRQLLDRPIEISQGSRVRLEGKELEDYMEAQKILKEEQKLLDKKKKEEEEIQKMMDSISDLTDENEIDERLYDLKNPFQSKFDMTSDQFRSEGFVPMFPFVEKHLKIGEYGEEDDEFIQKNLEELANGDKEMVPVNGEEEIEQDPSKIQITNHSLKVNCQIKYIDFEGCADGRSIKSIIQKISPNNLVLVRGRDDSAQTIINFVKENLRLKSVFRPNIEEVLDLTSDTNVYKTILNESLYNTIKYSKIMDYEIAFIQAKIIYTDTIIDQNLQLQQNLNGNNNNNNNIIQQTKQQYIPHLDIVPMDEVQGHNPGFIGDIKLSDFKQILIDNDIRVQFEEGALVCNDLVYLWRDEDSQGKSIIKLDGIVSDDYYKIRDLLYQQYQIL